MAPPNQAAHFLVVNEKDGDDKRGRSLLTTHRGNETQLLNDFSVKVQTLQTLKDEERARTNLARVSSRVRRAEEGNEMIEQPSSECPDAAIPYLSPPLSQRYEPYRTSHASAPGTVLFTKANKQDEQEQSL